jgi:peptidoglycan/xylan/chitin deacetylase (PgdA/CDA1 family)
MLYSHGRYSYSAIKGRPLYRWPNGAGLALYIAFGVEEYVVDQGMTENILQGASKPDLVNTSWRDYGNRVGAFRIFDRLQSLGIRPALLLNTEVYEHAPAVTDAARAIGAEFIAHGRTNSDTLATMSPDQEAAYLRDVADRIRGHEGAAPGGWSSPWLAHTPSTIDLLVDQGYRYLLDFRLDDQPVWLKTRKGRLLAIPYAIEVNDSSTAIGRFATGRDFADMIVDEFDEMLKASSEQPLVMSIVIHSFISGQPFRLRALTRALEHIVSHRDKIWLTRPAEISAFIEANPTFAPGP